MPSDGDANRNGKLIFGAPECASLSNRGQRGRKSSARFRDEAQIGPSIVLAVRV